MRASTPYLAALLFALIISAPITACPLCKDSIPESNQGSYEAHNPERLSKAYNYSILAFLAMPLILGGSVGLLIWRANRNAGRVAIADGSN